jgi:hypothetical protein
MEALNAMFHAANSFGLFTLLGIPSIKYWASLYADDLVIFVCPQQHDVSLVRDILEMFVEASGLHTNIAKCQFTPIYCTPRQIE